MRRDGELSVYRIEVELRGQVPGGMQTLVDVVADELERHGFSPHGDYRVEVHGPPECRIVMVDRSAT